MIADLPKDFNPIPGDIVPELDVTVTLMAADGRLYKGCLIDGVGVNDVVYWCEWISDNGLEECVGKDTPIGWKAE